MYRWLYYHTFDSRKSPRGFPDTVLVKNGVLLFVELKLPGRYLTPPQRVWANALHAVEVATSRRVRYLVVRPADLQRLADELAHAA